MEANGVYSFHLWNDEDDDTIFQGHMSHQSDRSRANGAQWDSGVTGNGTQGYLTPTNENVELKSTTGVVYQMHRHDIPAFDTSGSDVVLVKNWNGDAFHDITNLYDIVADSGGNAIGATKWFKIVIWGVANLGSSSFHPMMINLPSGFYNTQIACENDANDTIDTDIPDDFRGTGYYIASVVIQRAATWVIGSTKILLGETFITIGGGGARYTNAEAIAAVAGNPNVFTQIQRISSSQVVSQFLDTNSTTLERAWQFLVDNDQFQLQLFNDDFSSGAAGIVMTRTANVLDGFTLPAGVNLALITGLGSGIIISAAERTALHAIYTDANARTAADLLNLNGISSYVDIVSAPAVAGVYASDIRRNDFFADGAVINITGSNFLMFQIQPPAWLRRYAETQSKTITATTITCNWYNSVSADYLDSSFIHYSPYDAAGFTQKFLTTSNLGQGVGPTFRNDVFNMTDTVIRSGDFLSIELLTQQGTAGSCKIKSFEVTYTIA